MHETVIFNVKNVWVFKLAKAITSTSNEYGTWIYLNWEGTFARWKYRDWLVKTIGNAMMYLNLLPFVCLNIISFYIIKIFQFIKTSKRIKSYVGIYCHGNTLFGLCHIPYWNPFVWVYIIFFAFVCWNHSVPTTTNINMLLNRIKSGTKERPLLNHILFLFYFIIICIEFPRKILNLLSYLSTYKENPIVIYRNCSTLFWDYLINSCFKLQLSLQIVDLELLFIWVYIMKVLSYHLWHGLIHHHRFTRLDVNRHNLWWFIINSFFDIGWWCGGCLGRYLLLCLSQVIKLA